MDEAIDAANEIASEHLEIMTASPFEVMTKNPKCRRYIYRGKFKRTAWRLFCRTKPCPSDKWNSEILLPIVPFDDFIKKSSVISYSREALEEAHEDIIKFAKAEH